MKKFLSLCAILFTFIFTSCDSKDDTPPVQLIGNEFDGVYKGLLNVSANNDVLGKDIIQKIYIKKSGENKFKLELRDFSIEGLEIGDIIVENIDVKKENNTCSFQGSETIKIIVGDCLVDIDGTIKDKDLDIDIHVDLEEAGLEMKVVVDFKGQKLAADQSSQAEILSFSFDMSNEANKIVTSQPIIDGTDITFSVLDDATADQIKALTPTITISDKATVSPANNTAADFNNPVTYTVTSEDEINKVAYNVSISAKTNSLKFDFEEWETINYLFDFEMPKPIDVLESANRGTAFLSLYGFEGQDGNKVNTVKSEDAKNGLAAKLVTFDTRSIANALVPGITPGALYIGVFNVNKVFENRLKTTEFGMRFDKKEPMLFTGWYKYTPGEIFYDASDHENIVAVEGKTDECSIIAVLYEIEKDEDILTGVDINTSDKRVAVAALSDGTAKSEWTKFEIPFTFLEGKTYDPTKKYKITYTCSSSKEGDYFKGAPNSTLILDDLEISYKSHVE